jgi:primosomal protein N' (replication factor Y)
VFARIALAIPVRQSFVYAVPPALDAAARPGRVVRVPFGARRTLGVLLERVSAADLAEARVREIEAVLSDEPVLDAHGLALARWMSEYYLCPIGGAIAAQLPGGLAGLAKSRARRHADDEPAPVRPAAVPPRFTWTPAQAKAIHAVCAAVHAERFQTLLLHGVTGSGKTEVYLEAAAAARDAGGQTLVLVPEVSLTFGVAREFRRRFGGAVGILHSYRTIGERRGTWERARRGALDVVVGARSAVFAPLPRLRLIVVDEEHEPAYKQSEQIRYHGRDVAVMRASQLGVPCVLGSATPSLESYANARAGKYAYVPLPERVDRRPLPTTEIVDQRPPDGDAAPKKKRRAPPAMLTPRLAALVEAALSRGEQVLLFLNRRGHSRLVECDACGYTARCPHCDLALTFHSAREQFLCHYCEYAEEPRDHCPACGHPFFRYRIAGTQRIERELETLLPGIRLHRLDSDSARTRGTAERILDSFGDGGAQVLLGTQMIAKGLDFPGVTLVGVLDADTSLHLPDFRAGERTFQLLTQVAGRAGRGDRPGHVVLQTHHPDHPALIAATGHDYDAFALPELALRQAAGYPPYTRLVAFGIAGPDESRVVEAAASVAAWARESVAEPEVEILGPAPRAIAKLRGHHRWQVTLRAAERARVHAAAERLLTRIEHEKLPAGVKAIVDVDPHESF